MNPQKTHKKDVCVQYEKNLPMGFQDMLWKRKCAAGRTPGGTT